MLFGGDDRYVKDRLSAADLQGYRSIILPSPIDPTENQKAILRDFVTAGGTLVCQEPEAIGLTGEAKPAQTGGAEYAAGEFTFGGGRVIRLGGEMTPTGTNDIGAKFFKTYDPESRKQIAGLADRLELAPLVDGQSDGMVCAFPILQSERKRVVVHVVNYDVDYDRDAVCEKTRIRIRVPIGALATCDVKAELYAPDAAEPKPLTVTINGDAASCEIERLAICASVVFSGSTARP